MTELTEFGELEGKQYDLAGEVIGAAMKVHRILGPGFLEAVYGNALSHELRTQGFEFAREESLTVTYNGAVVGSYVADFVLGGELIIEVKAISTLAKAHEAQLVKLSDGNGHRNRPPAQFRRGEPRVPSPAAHASPSKFR